MNPVYGPPMPPVPWPTVTVGHRWAREGERPAYVAEAMVRAQRQCNAVAYLGDLYPPPVVEAEVTERGVCCFEPESGCTSCPIAVTCASNAVAEAIAKTPEFEAVVDAEVQRILELAERPHNATRDRRPSATAEARGQLW